MRRFRVKNLDKYQHYRDRRPPWIKLHAETLEDYEFSCLQDASKLHLILIWLLASRHNNSLPWDSQWLAREMHATDSINLDILHNAGFIEEIQQSNEMEQDASKTLAPHKQNAPRARVRGQRTEYSIPNGMGADRAVDPAKPCYDFGKPLLAKYDISAHKAGALITKWLKEHPPERVLSVIQQAGKQERHDIVAFIAGCLKDPLEIPEFLRRDKQSPHDKFMAGAAAAARDS